MDSKIGGNACLFRSDSSRDTFSSSGEKMYASLRPDRNLKDREATSRGTRFPGNMWDALWSPASPSPSYWKQPADTVVVVGVPLNSNVGGVLFLAFKSIE